MTSLKLPVRFAFTVLQLSVAGTLACSGSSTHAPGDSGAADSPLDSTLEAASDGATDTGTAEAQPSCEGGGAFLCEAFTDGAVCPSLVCDLSQCDMDAGCLAAA